MQILGIDVGGSNIKAAPVDVDRGCVVGQVRRVPTCRPATPAGVIEQLAALVQELRWQGSVGIGLPTAIRAGAVLTAANIDPAWIGLDAVKEISRRLDRRVHLINDADAAGLAEMRFGAGVGRSGTVLLITIGTGLGSALFRDGVLVPNTELGHLQLEGRDAEQLASDWARRRDRLDWPDYAARLNRYLQVLERLLFPDLIIIGGGLSHQYEDFGSLLCLETEVVRAKLQNDAGVVGAALAAREEWDV